MSSLTQPASSASSQSPGFTNLCWMEINAAVGPLAAAALCPCLLLCVFVCVCQVCSYTIPWQHTQQQGIPPRWIPRWKEVTVSTIWPVGVCPLYGDGLSGCRAFQRVGEMYPPDIVVYHPSGWRDRKKNKGKKKGASFSPYQPGKAMLCPCNCVGISSINSATLDNKYRVHRQLLWDLKRGCVKEYVCLFVHVCTRVCAERKN